MYTAEEKSLFDTEDAKIRSSLIEAFMISSE
jgi:hypothetical protein